MQTSDEHRIFISTEKGVTWFSLAGPHNIMKARLTMPELESLIEELSREALAWRRKLIENPYDLLGVSRTATPEEIQKAYRAMQRIHHPDAEGGSTERSQAINAAYAVLSDVEQRRVFDQTFGHEKGA